MAGPEKSYRMFDGKKYNYMGGPYGERTGGSGGATAERLAERLRFQNYDVRLVRHETGWTVYAKMGD